MPSAVFIIEFKVATISLLPRWRQRDGNLAISLGWCASSQMQTVRLIRRPALHQNVIFHVYSISDGNECSISRTECAQHHTANVQ